MKKTQILLLFIIFSACYSGLKDSEINFESANVAYDQFDLKKSRKILEAMLLIDTLQDGQKCNVLKRLAHQDWKYYKDYNLAKNRLANADSLGIGKYSTWMLICRIERESQNYVNSLNAATKAEKLAKSENKINLAKVAYAQTVYEFSVDELIKGNSFDEKLLSKTSKILTGQIKSNAGMPKPSKLLLGISLLNNDGVNVLKAWQSYFRIHNINNTYPYLLKSAETLSQVCEKWSERSLGLEEQEMLIDALSSSRFYEFIPVFSKINNNELNYNQKTKDAIIYSEHLKEIKDTTDEYYRLIAINKENKKAYKKWLKNKRKELWNNLSFLSQRTYNDNDFLNEIEKHFGAKGFTGSTGNYKGYVLCLGHIVNQEKAQVVQYGYKPEFIYTQIDMMVSNGYSSWFWEDKAIGGWASDSEIIRIREEHCLNEPIGAWKTITDIIERQKMESITNEHLNQQNTNPIEDLKGLAAKLRVNALYDLYQQLSSKGLYGQELKLAFLSTYENYRTEAHILAHEGRHGIEKKYMSKEYKFWDSEKKEFHAKLSEIVFATEPRLELSGMVNATGNSGHEKANKRITEIAIEWIKDNKEKVIGFTEDKSEYSQIYLMTVEQIKECYKQADPLNK